MSVSLMPSAVAANERLVPAALPLAPHLGGIVARAQCLVSMLDEVGNGLLLVDENQFVLHANRAAQALLAGEHPLLLCGGRLRARAQADAQKLAAALDGARRGRRRLLMLGDRAAPASVNVVPLDSAEEPGLVLLSLGRRQVGDRLALECFAQLHGLTATEARVLHALCNGVDPAGIAAMRSVGMATVRAQISSIRQKTGARDITALVRQVAQLPPMAARQQCDDAEAACGGQPS